MKKLSIVIPTRNRQDVLSKALQAYLNQKTLEGLLEIIVVDDHSSDGTEAIVADFRADTPRGNWQCWGMWRGRPKFGLRLS